MPTLGHCCIELFGDVFDVFINLEDTNKDAHLWFISAPLLAQSWLMSLQIHYWEDAIRQYYNESIYRFTVTNEVLFSTVVFRVQKQ